MTWDVIVVFPLNFNHKCCNWRRQVHCHCGLAKGWKAKGGDGVEHTN